MASPEPTYEIVTDLGFDEDMREAVGYYHRVSGVQSVERFLEKYHKLRELLTTLPRHGTPIEGTDLRWRTLGVFVAIYQVDDGMHRVTLLRLSYLSPNWLARLTERAAMRS